MTKHVAKFVAVMGAKGGCGKTTVTINLGSALNDFGREVILMDTNLT